MFINLQGILATDVENQVKHAGLLMLLLWSTLPFIVQ